MSHETSNESVDLSVRTSLTQKQKLVGFLVLAIVFSVQIDLGLGLSKFASVNSEDLAIALLAVMLVLRILREDDWSVTLTLPIITGLMIVVSVWLLITLVVAQVRSPYSILPNILWTLKWFEAIVLLIALQQYMDRRLAKFVIRTMLLAGSALAVLVLLSNLLPGVYSVRVFGRTVFTTAAYVPTRYQEMDPYFWGNPNAIGAFFSLMILSFFTVLISTRGRNLLLYVGAGMSFGVLILSGSRTALLALMSGLPVVLYGYKSKFSITRIMQFGAVVCVSLVVSFFLWDFFFIRRFLVWIEVAELVVSGQIFAQEGHGPVATRLSMARRGFRLFLEQPIFGYGWFSSPENPRVSVIDMHYPVLLVDLGLFGAGLMLTLYARILQTFRRLSIESDHWIPIIGTGWYIGLLVSGFTNSNIRVPRMMFITILLLVAARAMKPNST